MGRTLAPIMLAGALLLSCGTRSAEAPIHDSVPVPAPVLANPTQFLLNPNVENNWAWLHTMWTKTEWGGCLYGRQQGDTLLADAMILAMIFEADWGSVTFSCPMTPLGVSESKLIGMMHAHPLINGKPHCKFSGVDQAARDTAWALYPQLLVDVVLCDDDTYTYQLRGDTARIAKTSVEITPPDTAGR